MFVSSALSTNTTNENTFLRFTVPALLKTILICLIYSMHIQVYPSLVAQAVYSAFMHAFPTSWNSFDELFKSELCNIVFLWFTGME